MKQQDDYKVYGYRWVVLALYVAVATMIQIMWATFFAITLEAGAYYGFAADEAESAISLFSIIFMIGMIVVSIPSFAMFEKWGYKKSVGFGVILMTIGAMLRGIFGHNYTIVLICTILFAIAQPFILNAVGLVAGKWFPAKERATANGLGLLSNYVGIMIGLILVPVILSGGTDIQGMLMILGIVAAIFSALFCIFTKEAPPTPPCADEDYVREKFLSGMKQLFKKKDFIKIMLAFFLTLGVFNVFFTLIEPILQSFGGSVINSVQVGIIGVIMLIMAIVGSVVIPMLSDKDRHQRRKPYMVLGMALGTLGLGFMIVSHSFGMLTTFAIVYGLFGIGAGPITMTLAAEIGYPTSEGTSEGLLLLAGNIAGAVFLIAADVFSGNYTALMIALTAMDLIALALMIATREKKKDVA
ncbi:MAG: MFS transporter [Clostridiales Family XIII bacterium]|jgi:MFS family permease|nr:MFS transporter [Clostridiales Family XIII bacterium]